MIYQNHFLVHLLTINQKRKLLLIATGTGISPFHSFVASYPKIDYHILHGVRYGNEAYEREKYNPLRYTLCTSRDKTGEYNGRVSDHVRKYPVDKDTLVYLCGNCEMIYEVYDILSEQGFPAENIKTEVYF